MKRRYRIDVMMGLGRERRMTVVAENANDALITGLCEMGLVCLDLVTGITLREL